MKILLVWKNKERMASLLIPWSGPSFLSLQHKKRVCEFHSFSIAEFGWPYWLVCSIMYVYFVSFPLLIGPSLGVFGMFFFTRIFVRNLSCWVPSSFFFLTGCYLQFANVMFLQKHFKIPATCLKSPLVIQEFRFICLLVEFLDVQVQVSIHEFHSTPEVGIPWILTKKYEVLLWGYRFDFKNGLKLLEGYLLEQFVLFF